MLSIISWTALLLGLISAFIIIGDIIRHPQMMKVMNFVLPINGWFFGPVALWTYFKWGRLKSKDNEEPFPFLQNDRQNLFINRSVDSE